MKIQHETFVVSIHDYIADVAFNRPQKSNALHLQGWREMKAIFEALSKEEAVRVVRLTGHGKHFCAGIDLSLLMDLGQLGQVSCEARKRENIRSFILELQESISAVEKCKKPVIAAIHGACVGGGLDIVSACDMRFCSSDAFFSIKEVDLGLVADIGTLQRMPKFMNAGVMAELAFTGKKVTGVDAERIGLVNQNFTEKQDMLSYTLDLAKTIAQKSPLVIRGIKEILKYSREHRTEDALEYVATYNAAFLLSDDLQEAFRANITKQAPNFKS